MALDKQGNFSQQPSELPDVPSPSMTPDQIRAKWQTPLDEFKTTFNNAIDKLNSTTDGASGADNVGATGFDGTPSTTQALLENLNTNKATKGADWTGTWQGYTPSKADPGISSVVEQHTAQLAENAKKTEGFISVKQGDDIQAIIDGNIGKTVLIPEATVFEVATIQLPSFSRLKIEGTLKKLANTTGALITHKLTAPELKTQQIIISGNGTIDGNKANQTTINDQIGLVDFDGSDYLEFSVREVKKNYFPVATSTAQTTGCVYIKNSSFVKVTKLTVTDYAREAVWLKNCTDSIIDDLVTVGGVDSWSGLQLSGTRNQANNIRSYDAGATGISLDSTYSKLSNSIVKNNKYFNGFNFGHAGIPSDFSQVTNCHYINEGINVTDTSSNPASGFNIVAATTEIKLSDCTSTGAKEHGFNLSENTGKVMLYNCRGTGSIGNGLKLFGNTIQLLAANCDFRGNTGSSFNQSGSPVYEFTNVRLSDDPLFAAVDIGNLTAGATKVINNGNSTPRSRVIMQASNAAGNDSQPFLYAINQGSIQVTVKNASAASSFIRYQII